MTNDQIEKAIRVLCEEVGWLKMVLIANPTTNRGMVARVEAQVIKERCGLSPESEENDER